jgi:hypothetical protein
MTEKKMWTTCTQHIDVIYRKGTYRCSFKHESDVSDDELAWMVSIAHKKFAVCSIINLKTGLPVALASNDATVILQEVERRLFPEQPKLSSDEVRKTKNELRLERQYARERAHAHDDMRRKLQEMERIIGR